MIFKTKPCDGELDANRVCSKYGRHCAKSHGDADSRSFIHKVNVPVSNNSMNMNNINNMQSFKESVTNQLNKNTDSLRYHDFNNNNRNSSKILFREIDELQMYLKDKLSCEDVVQLNERLNKIRKICLNEIGKKQLEEGDV